MNRKNILVIGAGLSGCVVARTLAEHGYQVRIIEKRDHIGGNVFDYTNDKGIRIHKYGPHLFHTRNKNVFDWLSQYTEWLPYKHKVKAMLDDGRLVTLPVNQETIEIVGRENVISTFIRPYSEKMWGMKLENISPQITSRVPIREDLNEYYFPNDEFQAMPKLGYTKLIENILDHDLISVKLGESYSKQIEQDYFHVFNSMPIDEYFNFCFGKLDYRSIKFMQTDLPVPKIFPVSVVNLTNNSPYTRIVEWKNIPGHGDNPEWTSLTYEMPCSFEENNDERYYPVKDTSGKNQLLLSKYQSMIPTNLTFIGRLGLYQYLDMDQCVNNSLISARKFISKNA